MTSEILEIILYKFDFIIGLFIGLLGTLYSWHQRQLELKSRLYYPLFIACHNLLLIFDEIETIKNDEKQGRELYFTAAKHFDDIMNSYGTITNLKSKSKDPEKNYLNIFFKVKRIIDLNQNSIQNNWSRAKIWFENGKKKTYSGDDPEIHKKIDEFNNFYNQLLKLKELCEDKDRTLRDYKDYE